MELDPWERPRPGSAAAVEALEVYERAGDGHTLSRHCGRGLRAETERLADHRELRATGAFLDSATAQLAVEHCVAANHSAIERWRRSAAERLAIWHDTGQVVGDVLRRGDAAASPATAVRVVLRRNPAYRSGFAVVTGYPVVAAPYPRPETTEAGR